MGLVSVFFSVSLKDVLVPFNSPVTPTCEICLSCSEKHHKLVAINQDSRPGRVCR